MGVGTLRLAGITVGLCLFIVGLTVQPSGAEDAFARISGSIQGVIQGDQVAIQGIANSANTVQVFSTVFGLSNAVTTGGTSAGKPVAAPVALVKRFDRASPKLLRAAFTGEPLTVEIIWVMNLSGVVRQTVSIRLENALVTNMQASAELGSGNNASGFEEVSLSYARITFTTPTINAQNQVTGTTTVCLDVVNNKLC
jgi:type VI secretion system Hcp family effector